MEKNKKGGWSWGMPMEEWVKPSAHYEVVFDTFDSNQEVFLQKGLF